MLTLKNLGKLEEQPSFVSQLSIDSSPTDDQQLTDRLKTNSGLLKKKDRQTTAVSQDFTLINELKKMKILSSTNYLSYDNQSTDKFN